MKFHDFSINTNAKLSILTKTTNNAFKVYDKYSRWTKLNDNFDFIFFGKSSSLELRLE